MDSAKFALHRPEFLEALVRGEEKIATLMRGSEFERPAGSTLIGTGTEHAFIYRLIRGWVGRARLLADGRNQFILIFLPGDLFAVKSLFVTRHSDSIRTISKAVMERVRYDKLHDAYVSDGDVASRCIWQVMEEERRLHNWVVGLGQGDAQERLALLLLDFKGRLQEPGKASTSESGYDMPLTQTELADHLGITAVHVNRVLKEFRENGLVTIREEQVVIHDLDALVRLAGPLLDTYERNSALYVGDPLPSQESTP